MKLLFDENLSPRLVESLSDMYPQSRHVHQVHLGGAEDLTLWEYAKRHGFAIVSKDSDFAERCVLDANPPKIIWLRLGNCSTQEVQWVLQAERKAVLDFLDKHGEVCLVLGRHKVDPGTS